MHWLHENVPGIRMTFQLAYESPKEFVKWAYDHRDRYSVSHAHRFVRRAVLYRHYDDLLWIYALCDEELPPGLFNDLLHELFRVNEIKWLYERYPTRYFDDPYYSCTNLDVLKWFLTEFEWKDEFARIEWIEKCLENAANYTDGHEIIEFLYTIRPESNAGHDLGEAVWRGSFDLVQFLHVV